MGKKNNDREMLVKVTQEKYKDIDIAQAEVSIWKPPSDTLLIIRSGGYDNQHWIAAPYDEAVETWRQGMDGLCTFLLADRLHGAWRLSVRTSDISAIIDHSAHE